MMDGNGDGGELVNHAQVDGWRGKGWKLLRSSIGGQQFGWSGGVTTTS